MLTRAQSGTAKKCAACLKTSARTEFPRITPTTACEHEVEICTSCVRRWFKASVNGKYQPQVRCPTRTCGMVLVGNAELMLGSNKEDYNRYRYIHTRISRSSNPEWKYCLNPACESQGQRHPPPPSKGEDAPPPSDKMCCHTCHSYSCTKCDRPWHEGLTCEEFQEKRADHGREDEMSDLLKWKMKADGRLQACPNCDCLVEICPTTKELSCIRCLHNFSLGKSDVPEMGMPAVTEPVAPEPVVPGPVVVPERKERQSQKDRKVTFSIPEERLEAAPVAQNV